MTLQGLLCRGGGGRAGPEPVPGAKGAVGWSVGTGWAGWGSEQDGTPFFCHLLPISAAVRLKSGVSHCLRRVLNFQLVLLSWLLERI